MDLHWRLVMEGLEREGLISLRDRLIVEMYCVKHMTQAEIAKEFGVSQARVLFILRRAGKKVGERGL